VASAQRRPRHDPKETEREILDAAGALLRDRPFREFTVDGVMRRTTLKRPAFYVHFRDRHDVALRVVEEIAAELSDMTDRWLRSDDPRAGVRSALEGIAAVYVEHGSVMRAISDAAGSDARVEETYEGLVQGFVDATARHIRAQQAAGEVADDLDPDETGRALILMNERYLGAALGGRPQLGADRVVDVLERIWISTLYPTG
jgi:TetR/AcrR family transcriptional regulator, ethionamide resistance regulator